MRSINKLTKQHKKKNRLFCIKWIADICHFQNHLYDWHMPTWQLALFCGKFHTIYAISLDWPKCRCCSFCCLLLILIFDRYRYEWIGKRILVKMWLMCPFAPDVNANTKPTTKIPLAIFSDWNYYGSNHLYSIGHLMPKH